MANDLPSFSRRIKARASKLGANVNRAVRKLALVIDRELVLATPVDTGRARSNWIVSLGIPETEVREPYKPHAPGSKGGGAGTGEGANAQEALTQGAGVIARRRQGQSIHITNNVPYITKLDAGHSKQAPANFVRRSIMNGIAVLRATKVIE
jgi:hypothetical protein